MADSLLSLNVTKNRRINIVKYSNIGPFAHYGEIRTNAITGDTQLRNQLSLNGYSVRFSETLKGSEVSSLQFDVGFGESLGKGPNGETFFAGGGLNYPDGPVITGSASANILGSRSSVSLTYKLSDLVPKPLNNAENEASRQAQALSVSTFGDPGSQNFYPPKTGAQPFDSQANGPYGSLSRTAGGSLAAFPNPFSNSPDPASSSESGNSPYGSLDTTPGASGPTSGAFPNPDAGGFSEPSSGVAPLSSGGGSSVDFLGGSFFGLRPGQQTGLADGVDSTPTGSIGGGGVSPRARKWERAVLDVRPSATRFRTIAPQAIAA